MTNHGVPESLMNSAIDGCDSFFHMSEEEKLEFRGKHVLDPIRCGTSFNASVDEVLYWRDFLKVLVHPQFHFPKRPSGFRYFIATPISIVCLYHCLKNKRKHSLKKKKI